MSYRCIEERPNWYRIIMTDIPLLKLCADVLDFRGTFTSTNMHGGGIYSDYEYWACINNIHLIKEEYNG